VTTQQDGENHEVIPHHHPIKTGTLAGILKRIAAHHSLTSNFGWKPADVVPLLRVEGDRVIVVVANPMGD